MQQCAFIHRLLSTGSGRDALQHCELHAQALPESDLVWSLDRSWREMPVGPQGSGAPGCQAEPEAPSPVCGFLVAELFLLPVLM